MTASIVANGNLRQRGGTTLAWDARNRLSSANDGSMQATYLYGPGANRIRQVVQDGETTKTTYYIDDYAELRDGTLTLYIFDDKSRVAQVTAPFERTQLLTGFSDSAADLAPVVSSILYGGILRIT